ncbi:MAG: LysR family transcriptional regulator [Sphingomonadales bacterium]|nr:LysR family transcriptional regulator [Sphingomonadales bacterium]MDE2623607.1 LysR family transcriptional regulator [Betaproteobacteria bacterium]
MAKLPPLNLLLAVEAATRLASFRRAAEELLITPSAISHRIKSVEAILGAPLFKRAGYGIEPLPAALEIAHTVAQAMHGIQKKWDQIQDSASREIVHVSSLSAFSSQFILPNFADLKRTYKNLHLRISSVLDSCGLDRGDFDVSILFCTEPPSLLWAEKLLDVELVPIVRPDLHEGIVRDGKLIGPLLGYQTAPDTWQYIAEEMGVVFVPASETITIETFEAACIAAVDGIGVAVVPHWVAAPQIELGRVVAMTSQPIRANASYWIATRPGEQDLPVIAGFRRWIKRQVQLLA